MRSLFRCLLAVSLIGCAASANAQSSLNGATFHVTRTTNPIRIDGDVSDEARKLLLNKYGEMSEWLKEHACR